MSADGHARVMQVDYWSPGEGLRLDDAVFDTLHDKITDVFATYGLQVEGIGDGPAPDEQ